MADNNQMEAVFANLIRIVFEQRDIIKGIATELNRIKAVGGGGGGGTGNGFQVYESDKVYKKYQALIDPDTDTPYLVVPAGGLTEYTSISVQQDCADGNLKLLGFDSQIVPFDHTPTPTEISRIPENTVVVEYNPMDTPYMNILNNDNQT